MAILCVVWLIVSLNICVVSLSPSMLAGLCSGMSEGFNLVLSIVGCINLRRCQLVSGDAGVHHRHYIWDYTKHGCLCLCFAFIMSDLFQ